MDELFDYETKLALIPHKPGCYIMRDRRGRIVYVGKAKDLKNRVRSYFASSGDTRAFVQRLPKILSDIETIVTANEKEALVLENTLIKAHKPRYNVLLKDDKNFLSLRIDQKKDWPRVEVVRRQHKDGARYFGPYTDAPSIRRTLSLLNKYFQLRTCTDAVLNNRERPCLQYQIKRCPGPCVFDIDRGLYDQHVKDAILFLEGRGDELLKRLQEKMYQASDEMEFERAANYRDQILSIKRALERQTAVTVEKIDRDVVGFHREGDRLTVQLMFVRGGKLEGAKSFGYKDQEFPDQELISSFLNLYYASGSFVPKEVLVPVTFDPQECEAFEELLSDLKGQKVNVYAPQRGAKRALLDTANENARVSFEKEHDKDERTQDLLENLQNRLGLRNYPERIECYDISNFQGRQIVGSMVVFEDGIPAKAEYRRYKMKLVTSQDDFASMNEILTRRFSKVALGESEAPSLVVIDGGKGQLGQAAAVLHDLGLHEIDLISLAKSRVDKVGFEDSEITRSTERVFLPGRKNPIVLKQNSAELYLLERIRDEAHRFAITFHKELRRKESMKSVLDDIPGIGEKTRKDLLKHFGSLKKIREADLEALQNAPGIGPKTAQSIYEFLHDD
ncbi:MAG: excinuclease ABC subunit UvrC [bacterium]